ncbi:hypothetical protein K435DRAFT_803419 [Dendrothele bispora CBS 962.96]|uniref:Uncharacterized protein n=1 Tax=Dendrothele bispora (strain CBS 962.96) TaxID=1314807 RepID=A0A4S8LHP3_DENBC|nr:hypothetical protein K435DRAFT_803419 [Dendrothele bispora CBS 962.96]
MTHDDSQFCKPDHFIPETWIRSNMIWITIASVLATKNIFSLPIENIEDYSTDGTFCSTKRLDCHGFNNGLCILVLTEAGTEILLYTEEDPMYPKSGDVLKVPLH